MFCHNLVWLKRMTFIWYSGILHVHHISLFVCCSVLVENDGGRRNPIQGYSWSKWCYPRAHDSYDKIVSLWSVCRCFVCGLFLLIVVSESQWPILVASAEIYCIVLTATSSIYVIDQLSCRSEKRKYLGFVTTHGVFMVWQLLSLIK